MGTQECLELISPTQKLDLLQERPSIDVATPQEVDGPLDHEREQWSVHLYGMSGRKATLHDLVVRVGRLTVEDAAETICRAAQLPQFQATRSSRQRLADRDPELCGSARLH